MSGVAGDDPQGAPAAREFPSAPRMPKRSGNPGHSAAAARIRPPGSVIAGGGRGENRLVPMPPYEALARLAPLV